MVSKLSIFMIPPFLTLVMGITLAVISLARGAGKSENVLFSLVCIWWCMLSPLFILHHLISEEKILIAERAVHFFYVYIPVIYLLFFHKILNIKRNYLIYISIVLSLVLSLSTLTDYYIQGLYKFSWGYIAKGGIAFQFFGLYGIITMIYLIVCVITNLKKEKGHATKLRNKYILISFLVTGFLTVFNLPAINGIDFYPAGNFSFIPLGILAYGVLKYRLLEIRSFLHITIFWVVTSSIIVFPNMYIFYKFKPFFPKVDTNILFAIFVFWFLVDYFYVKEIQPIINNTFNRMRHRLRQAEVEFNKIIASVNSINDIINELVTFFKKTLSFEYIDLFRRVDSSDVFISSLGQRLTIDRETESLFVRSNRLVDRNMAERDPKYSDFRDKILKAFNEFNCHYMIPLVYKDRLAALLFLPEPLRSSLSMDDTEFMNRVMASLVRGG
ncbi:hypothetical protein ACFL2O_03065 [Thermodesulfobacteriota bacterium]